MSSHASLACGGSFVDATLHHELLHAFGASAGLIQIAPGLIAPQLLPPSTSSPFTGFYPISAFSARLVDTNSGVKLRDVWDTAAAIPFVAPSTGNWTGAFKVSPMGVPAAKLYDLATQPGRLAFKTRANEDYVVEEPSTFLQGRS